MRAYILCGGLGTRLRSITQDGQKVLVDIAGRPFLSLVLEQLSLAGISDAVLCAGYRSDLIKTHIRLLTSEYNLNLSLVEENRPLGTGGALLNALKYNPTANRFMLLNADTFVDSTAYRLIAQSTAKASILAIKVLDRSRFGSLTCNSQGKVTAIHEKTLSGAGLINGGVYTFSPELFISLPVTPCAMERDILPGLISKGYLQAVEYSGTFHDIGTPDSLTEFKRPYQT